MIGSLDASFIGIITFEIYIISK